MAGPTVNHHFIVPAVAAAGLDLIVHLANDAACARRVHEVLAVHGRASTGHLGPGRRQPLRR
ncbi:MAG: hypothetical protein ACTHK1_05215 [Actinomycetales bacterium]